MRRHHLALFAVALVLLPGPKGPSALAGDPTTGAAGQDAVKARTRALLDALRKGDPRELAQFWTATGEYLRDELSIRGRANLEKAYAAAMKGKATRDMVVQGDTVRFLTDDAAIHEGTFVVKKPNPADGGRSRFSALYLRVKGQWQIGILRETPLGPSALDLDWLVGAWNCKTDTGQVHLVFTLTEGKAFLRGRVTVKSGDDTTIGYQVIGRDPATGGLRSWTFEEDGGIGEGHWERTEKGWTAKVIGFNAEGEKVTATTTLTPLDADTFHWHSTERTVDGEKAPNLGPFRVTRDRSKK